MTITAVLLLLIALALIYLSVTGKLVPVWSLLKQSLSSEGLGVEK